MQYLILFLYLLYLPMTTVLAAPSGEDYRFDRLWPTLQQPWYFEKAYSLAVDSQGYVYVSNQTTETVSKFTSDGHFVRQWKFGKETPISIKIGSNDRLYVLYERSNVVFIRVFDASGEVIKEWGERNQPTDGSFVYDLRSETLAVGKNLKDNREDEVYLFNRYILEGASGSNGIGYPILQRFTWDGTLTGRWPLDDKPIKPDWHISLAIDRQNHIYVLYKSDNRLVKYEIDDHNQPKKLQEWGGFNSPDDITVDSQDNVYVNDTNNHRILKMLSPGNGKFETWTDKNMAPESVNRLAEAIRLSPLPISDKSGPTVLSRIKEVLPAAVNSKLSGLWTVFDMVLDFSAGPQRFFRPRAIAIGRSPTTGKDEKDENVYITLATPDESIRQYNALTKVQRDWQSRGQGKGGEHMFAPWDIARDSQGILYVSDAFNHRVLKFQDTGKFISAIGEMGVGEGQFILPTGVTVDHQDNLYVVDTGNLRIQKFDAKGKFLYKLGGIKLPENIVGKVDKTIQFIFDHSEFVFPVDVAVDNQNNLYVADLAKNNVKKFTAAGRPVEAFNQQSLGQEFQSWGNDYGQLNGPIGVMVDQHDNLYVLEALNNRIQQFTSNGDYVNSWGSKDSQVECNFGEPVSMAIDNQGVFYLLDAYRKQALKIEPHETSCELLTQWGEEGNLPNQFNELGGLAVTPDGERVFLVDTQNNRVQVFKKGLFMGGKAIIVAGGGPKDSLWDVIERGAQFAYRTLTYQGFTKETIYYLSADTNTDDLDNNGLFDDIDAVHTKENLEKAITEWAMDTDNLTFYLIDHGGNQIFQLNDESGPAKSQVTATELDGWLHIWQEHQAKGVITFIYEACESGSFIKTLAGKNRILITSTAEKETAALTSQGALSFTNYFWNHIFYGLSIEDAFLEAKDSVISSAWMSQQPQVDDTGNLRQGRYIGNGTAISGTAPVITTATLDTNNQNPTTITAEVNSASGNRIARVWAVIIYENLQSDATNRPLTALPSCELNFVAGTTNQFAGECDKLDREGRYQVAIYAYDETGNISKPKLITDVPVGPVPEHKAMVIVAGDEDTHPRYQELVGNTKQVYNTLRLEGYNQDDINYMANVSLGNLPTRAVTLDNVKTALTTWLQEGRGTQDLVIYLTGSGNKEGWQLNKEEFLAFETLKEWLDDLQNTQLPGPVVVIDEGLDSGYLLPALANPPAGKQRIVISSTKRDGPIYQEGVFTNLFWQEIAKAFNVQKAFDNIAGTLSSQAPQLDDNGNGVFQTGAPYDGEVARTFKMGLGIGTAELPNTQLSQKVAVRYQEGKLQVSLPPLPEGYSQYVGLQTPDGSLVILKRPLTSDLETFTESFELFTGIDSMPVWEGTGEVAIAVEVGDQIPRGEYMVYRYVQEKEITLTEQTFKPANLSKTGFYLR